MADLDRVKYHPRFFGASKKIWVWVNTRDTYHQRCHGCGKPGWNHICGKCKGTCHTMCVGDTCAPCKEEKYGGP